MTEWLTIKQAAERYNISTRTIRRRINEGHLKVFRTCGDTGDYWIDVDSLEDFFGASEKRAIAILKSMGLKDWCEP